MMGTVDDEDFDNGQWGTSNIDLVAEPVRYPRSPLIALLALAVLPAIGLLVLLRWSDNEADAYESSRGEVGLFETKLDGEITDDEADTTSSVPASDSLLDPSIPELATSIFDYRRAPAAVATVASAGQLQAAVEPVFGYVGPTSCVAVAIDGVTISAANVDVPVIPASNQKLFVALAALEILGPEFRYTTSVAVPAIVEGVVDGDIYLIGGGDPVLTSDDYPIEKAAARLATGKWFNGGQTCIAPDYVMVDAGRRDALVEALKSEITARYGSGNDADFTRIVNDDQYARLQGYLDDARERGATVIPLGDSDPATRLFAPTLVLDAGDDAKLMQEEIFGPILPIRGYRNLDEAIAHVNANDRPLALYPFSHDRAQVERILGKTLSGGVTVNDTLLQFAINALPFGGIGASGMGAYHGRAGFDAFSKRLPIVWQSRLAGSDLLKPPYSRVDRFIKLLLR